MIGSLIVILAVAGLLAYAAARKPASAARQRPGRLLSRTTPLSADEVLARAEQFGRSAGYGVDHIDGAAAPLVLSQGAGLFSFGFFYPLFLTPTPGGTMVELGIQSRAFQFGPLVTRAHRKLFEGLTAALAGPPARP